MPRTIKAYLRIYYSKLDKYGNNYFAFEWEDATTGKSARGTISGGESNIRTIVYHMEGMDVNSVLVTVEEMKIRAWNAMTKPWPYAGCTGKDLAAFVKDKLQA